MIWNVCLSFSPTRSSTGLLLLTLCLFVQSLYAQAPSKPVPLKASSDTTLANPILFKSDSLKKSVYRNPTTATLLSAALPGLGQYYNRSYWKIPIVYGVLGFFGYQVIQQNNLFNQYKNLYTQKLAAGDASAENYRGAREVYRSNRDEFAIYMGLAYLLNILDAYIEAHLSSFDVSDDLTLKAEPKPFTPQVQLISFKIKF
jgi:hypothetical protein